jgi:hypothetical protein
MPNTPRLRAQLTSAQRAPYEQDPFRLPSGTPLLNISADFSIPQSHVLSTLAIAAQQFAQTRNKPGAAFAPGDGQEQVAG